MLKTPYGEELNYLIQLIISTCIHSPARLAPVVNDGTGYVLVLPLSLHLFSC